MREIIFLIALAFCISATAQTNVEEEPNYIYCQIVGQGKMLSKKVTVTIDTGNEESSNYWKQNFLKDDSGNPIVFNTMIAALNYMASKKWEFVQAYTITIGNQNVYHYLLKKKAGDLSEEEKGGFTNK